MTSATQLRKHVQLERSFVILIAVMGLVLFMIAASMTHVSSRSSLVTRYELASRSLMYNFRGNGSGTVSPNTARYLAQLLARTTTVPPTDPPWMRQSPPPPEPLSPFKPTGPHPFLRRDVITSPHVCRNVSVDVLIVIHSAVTNFQRRRILRETWAQTDILQGLSVRRVFALGVDSSNAVAQLLVNTEQANYGDIVQGDFSDTFANLTYKAVNMLRWINDHCLHARFVLKSDDDIFVNVFHLAEVYLQRLAGQNHTVMCSAKAANTSIVVRDPKSKWFVPKSLLPGRTHWPAFCSGFVTVLTTDNVPQLYGASFRAPFIPVDDGYVYGMLPLAADKGYALRYLNIGNDLLVDDGKLSAQYQDPGASPLKLGGTELRQASFLRLWQLTLERLSPWGRARARVLQPRVDVSAMAL